MGSHTTAGPRAQGHPRSHLRPQCGGTWGPLSHSTAWGAAWGDCVVGSMGDRVGGSMAGTAWGAEWGDRMGAEWGDRVGGSMGDCVGAAWGDRVGGSMADHVWVEPTYPCESTVSRAPSSSPDRVEKSFRRMGGSRAGWRQLLRMGTSWGKASPRAGPRAQTGASFLCGRRMGGRSPAATLAASGGACWARPADMHPQLWEGCSQHRTPGSASPFDPPPTMALIVWYVSFLFFPTSYQILKKI